MENPNQYMTDSDNSFFPNNLNNNNIKIKEFTHSLTVPNNQKLINNLQKIWTNEKFCKGLLKYEDEFVSELMELIEKREKEIQNLNRNNSLNKDLNIKEDAEILELDLERTKFLLKDYLRIRLCKIEKYLYHIIKNDLCGFLSENEIVFAWDLFKIKRNYFNENFNKKIHESFNDFVPNNIKDEIVVGPPYNSYVYCKSVTYEPISIYLKDIWPDSGETVTIGKDDIFCLPYVCIK